VRLFRFCLALLQERGELRVLFGNPIVRTRLVRRTGLCCGLIDQLPDVLSKCGYARI
jgi:hypothetical protein